MRVQLREQFIFSGQRAFLGEPVKRCAKQRLRPLTFVDAFGTPGLGARGSCVHLGDGSRVERPKDHAPTSLLPPVVSARVGHEMFERAEQKGTEASLIWIGTGISA